MIEEFEEGFDEEVEALSDEDRRAGVEALIREIEEEEGVTADSVRDSIAMIEVCNHVIAKYFEGFNLYDTNYMLESHWFTDGREIHFVYEGETINEADDFTCAFTIIRDSLCVKEPFTVAHVDDGCGNNFSVIFDNAKRHKEFE